MLNKQLIFALLKSKRFWVAIVTLAAHCLTHYHILVSDQNISEIADQLVLIVGSVGIIGTKVLDHQAALAVSAPPPPAAAK
jgi:hypothetical protein